MDKYDRSYRQYIEAIPSSDLRQELVMMRDALSVRNESENAFGDYNENVSYVDSIEKAYHSRKLIFFIDIIVAVVVVMVVFNIFNISAAGGSRYFKHDICAYRNFDGSLGNSSIAAFNQQGRPL
jgi:hypothetical protein